MKSLSRVRLLATPWTAAHQAPPPMGFSRQEYWSGVPLPSPITDLKKLFWHFILNQNCKLPLTIVKTKVTGVLSLYTYSLLRNSALGLKDNLQSWPCHVSLDFKHSTAEITWRNKDLPESDREWGKLEGGAEVDQEQTTPASLSLLLFSAISHHCLHQQWMKERSRGMPRANQVQVGLQWMFWGIVWDWTAF